MKQRSRTGEMCCYCGVNPADTKDHIPPRKIFNKPRPSNLITVPACFTCNNSASLFDERFKVYLGMHVARQGGEAERLFKSGVLPSVRHNQKLHRKIRSELKPVDMVTPSGTFLGKGSAVKWDSEAHDQVIVRLTKGLYYHHFGKSVPPDTSVEPYYFNELPKDIELDYYTIKSIGNEAFVYAFAQADDVEFASSWIFQFYNGHWAGAFTIPASHLSED